MSPASHPPLRRAVVTGGAGLVGSHVCTQLRAAGVAVVSVDTYATSCPANLAHLADDAGFMAVQHDLVEPVRVQGPVDLVLHLASPTLVEGGESRLRRVLVGPHGTRTALELAREKGARFVFACSAAQSCGDEMEGGEALTTAYRHAYDMDTSVARVFDSYGPQMTRSDRGTVAKLLRRALAHEPVLIPGDGSQRRSVCYVEDIAAGLVAMTRHSVQGPIELGNPARHTLLELARTVIEATDSASPLVFVDAAAREMPAPDITGARDALGWQPKVSWPDGLTRTIASMRGALSGLARPRRIVLS